MRVLLAFDAVDDATKRIVRIITGILKDTRWRLDSYDVSEAEMADIETSDVLVAGCSTEVAVREEVLPTSPPMADFLAELPPGVGEGRHAAAFDTRFDYHIEGRSAAASIEIELSKLGYRIIHPALSLLVERDKPLKVVHVKRAQNFARGLKGKIAGVLFSKPV